MQYFLCHKVDDQLLSVMKKYCGEVTEEIKNKKQVSSKINKFY